ncbi:hypothetical protein K7432_013449 [Basidiobolus ranarum]|uniref:Phytosulfokine-beta n=1 Tax=Basidiobolus ranarum TaxID=34480 RepID=A0ABR2WJ81_9FUNG
MHFAKRYFFLTVFTCFVALSMSRPITVLQDLTVQTESLEQESLSEIFESNHYSCQEDCDEDIEQAEFWEEYEKYYNFFIKDDAETDSWF